MPVDAHMAIGYGAKTTYCDMLLFQSHILHSRVLDCFHHSGESEYIDKQQDWTTEIVDYGSRRTKLFTARRALDTGDPDDFMFQLDREMVIAYSFNVGSVQFENQDFDNKHTLLLLSDGQVYHGWGELFD